MSQSSTSVKLAFEGWPWKIKAQPRVFVNTFEIAVEARISHFSDIYFKLENPAL